MKHTKLIGLVAGHSGGHIIPGMLIAAAYQKQYKAELLFFSTQKELDAIITQHYKPLIYKALAVPTGMGLWQRIRQWYMVGKAYIESLSTFLQHKPILIISTGGLVSVPVCLAAYCLKIPVHVVELNAVPGKAVLFLVRFATVVSVVFQQTIKAIPSAVFLTYPVRFTIEDKMITQQQALEHLQLPPSQFTLLILGGSKGSSFINAVIQQFFVKNPHLCAKISVIHQTGHGYEQELITWYKDNQIQAHVFSYDHALQYAYQAADLVVCRAGSGVLHEVAFFAKKAYVIPLVTKTTDHQLANAHAMKERYPQLITIFEQRHLQVSATDLFSCMVQEYERYVMYQKDERLDLLGRRLHFL